MTPFLLFYGIPPAVAVGTDLAYAAIAKSLGVWLRHKARSIDWRTAFLLMCGSLPTAATVILSMKTFALDTELFGTIITRVLAVSLVLTSLTVLGQHWLQGSGQICRKSAAARGSPCSPGSCWARWSRFHR